MAKWKIKDLFKVAQTGEQSEGTFLFQDYYDAPTQEGEEPPMDVRPGWIKLYVDTTYNLFHTNDFVIGEKYGDYLFLVDANTVEDAYDRFVRWNIVYTITHRTELDMVYKALTSEFNPVENYDRYEQTDVHTDSSGGAKSQTSPDDSETFYNVGNAESEAESDVGTTSRIHGNIGVTEAVTMIGHTVDYFGSNAMYDYLIDKIITDNCILVDYGDNAL